MSSAAAASPVTSPQKSTHSHSSSISSVGGRRSRSSTIRRQAAQTVGIPHHRPSFEDMSPFEDPDEYYGPKTDPANRKTPFGRMRTISAVFPRPTPPVSFNPTYLDSQLAVEDSEDVDEREACSHEPDSALYSHKRRSHATNGLFELDSDDDEDDDDDGDGDSLLSFGVPPHMAAFQAPQTFTGRQLSPVPQSPQPEEQSTGDSIDGQQKAQVQPPAPPAPPARSATQPGPAYTSTTAHKLDALQRRQHAETKLGGNREGFISVTDNLAESDFDDDEICKIASPANSTGSLVALANEQRINNAITDFSSSGIGSARNASEDSLVSNTAEWTPQFTTNEAIITDEEGYNSPDEYPKSFTATPEKAKKQANSSYYTDIIDGPVHRTKSYVQRYNRGMEKWNLMQSQGQMDEVLERRAHQRALSPHPDDTMSPPPSGDGKLRRRASADNATSKQSKRFFISDIDSTLNQLLENEDTDGNCQITIEDTGPKVLKLGTANSGGYNQYDVRGTYMLSNLLQELTIAKRMGRKQMILDEARLNENPVDRLSRLIQTVFWKNLTRQITFDNINEMAFDEKIDSPDAKYPRVYVPHGEREQYTFFKNASEAHPQWKLDVEYLPENVTDEWVKSINGRPGFLALAMRHRSSEYGDLEGYPYLVPGGRFNEQYGWDSYFMELGLLHSGKVDAAIGMCRNFIFEITHYGKILNANRSYYLCRSQPPFLTQMALSVYNYVRFHEKREELDLLRDATVAAIKEYNEVWCSHPRRDPKTGLSTYWPGGLGIPPETEATHFYTVLRPYCMKYKLSFEEFTQKYNDGEIKEPDLDEYFINDRGVRESGHDTTYRLEGICAHLATVDLNSLLYKYETDIAFIIKEHFNDNFVMPNGTVEKSAKWTLMSKVRKMRIDQYLWDEENSLYYDYNCLMEQRSTYESVTALWPLWAGCASQKQADALVHNSVKKFEEFGGLVSSTKRSVGSIGMDRPSRQWDYPFAWAPHQVMAWKGLTDYGYYPVARRLAYRWCSMMTQAFVDFNGIVVEKYDATSERQPHKVEAEYGNQGSDFKGVATEGFGWVNASYLIGLGYLDRTGIRALGMVTALPAFFDHMRASERHAYALDGAGNPQLGSDTEVEADEKTAEPEPRDH